MVVKFTIKGAKVGGWDHLKRLVKRATSELAQSKRHLRKIKGQQLGKA